MRTLLWRWIKDTLREATITRCTMGGITLPPRSSCLLVIWNVKRRYFWGSEKPGSITDARLLEKLGFNGPLLTEWTMILPKRILGPKGIYKYISYMQEEGTNLNPYISLHPKSISLEHYTLITPFVDLYLRISPFVEPLTSREHNP